MRSSGTPCFAQSSNASSSQGMPSSPPKTVTTSRVGVEPQLLVTNSQANAMASSLK